MAETERVNAIAAADPHDSPFVLPAIEGLPFEKDSAEARAIKQVIEQADRERAEASKT